MLNTNDEIERIINWQEVIKDLTPELEKKYIAEYGKQHEELIKHRIRNMILIPESTPNITYDFFKHYKGDCIPYNIEIEALDYKKVEEELLEKLLQNMYVVICETLKIDPHKYKDEIMEIVRLPFFCCSSDFQSIYSDEIIKVEIKGLDILKETYLTKLINLGIKPLIDPQKIDNLIQRITLLNKNYHTKLIEKTIWGKRNLIELNNKLKRPITAEELSKRIFEKHGCCTTIRHDNNTIDSLLIIPLIKNYMQVGGLDLIFHHELHHVVENSILGSGLHIRNNPMYLVLNELRTEQNAKKTTEQFDKIFSKEIYKQDYKNVYEALFPLADDFLLWYKNILNQCAITQDITKLEEIFGKEDVRDYGQNLLTVHNVFKKYMKKELSPSYKISGQPFIEFQEKLRENAESNGIKIFQKTL